MGVEVFTGQQENDRADIEIVYERVQAYSDGIRRTDEYQALVKRYDAGTLEQFPSGTLPTVDFYLRRGIASSIQAVELLAILTNPQKHLQLLKEFDEEIVPDGWIEQIVMGRETGQDDYGLSTLHLVKERDMHAIAQKIGKDLDSQQRAGYMLHAEVVGSGHDLIINKYASELQENGYLPGYD